MDNNLMHLHFKVSRDANSISELGNLTKIILLVMVTVVVVIAVVVVAAVVIVVVNVSNNSNPMHLPLGSVTPQF